MFSAAKTSGPSGYTINNSVRLRSSASAYLNRTPASAGSQTTWTWSGWVKRGALSAVGRFMSAGSAASDQFGFTASDTFQFMSDTTGQNLVTTQVFRDPSAWYHFVIVLDSTQATAANRAKIYVNGSQVTALSTATYPAQNSTTLINGNTAQNIGRRLQTAGEYFDGYLSEVNFIDGQALTPSSFGSTNTTTGVWQPAKYTGTYGTNGFYLQFSNIATTSGSNTGLGKDFSGNGNYWTTNNISVTTGTTYDAMIDSPTMGASGTQPVGNYAVLNPLYTNSSGSIINALTNGNLKLSTATSNTLSTSTIAMPNNTTNKWYCEMICTLNGGGAPMIGITQPNSQSLGSSTYKCVSYRSNGSVEVNGTTVASGLSSFTTGDTLSMAVDMTTSGGQITFYKNNASVYTVTGLNSQFSGLDIVFGCQTNTASTTTWDANFGQRPFAYTPPNGYVALCTTNLPDSTVKKGNIYMDATLYTGNGSSPRTITNAAGFYPDFTWVKDRSTASFGHNQYDSVRGTGKLLISNATAAEITNDVNGYVSAFNSNGFTLTAGSSSNNGMNSNGDAIVAWQWNAGSGSTSSNTSGSITSTTSVNATAGFSIVTFNAGASGNQTVGHGLGVAPKMVILKDRANAVGWFVYIPAVMATNQYMTLNTTLAITTSGTIWGASAPTSSVFGFTSGSCITPNANGVAYCFAEIAGYSKFGSYTGNGSADGPFVYLGFRPKFIMIKRTDATQNWPIVDTSRDTYNVANKRLFANLSDAEDTGIPNYMDILSNGFKCRDSNISYNASGGTYIYMAFAENPFKNALAR